MKKFEGLAGIKLDQLRDMRASLFLLLSLWLTVSLPMARAESFCVKALTPTSTPEELIEQKHWQEALWRLYDQGRMAEAQALEHMIVSELLTATPTKKITVKSGGVYKLTFGNGIQALYKHADSFHSPEAEPIAYAFDKALGHIFRVPITVWRKDSQLKGSLQLYLPKVDRHKVPLPLSLWIFDMLIGNFDRSDGHNVIRSASGDLVAIDNEAALFLTRKPNVETDYLLKRELKPYYLFKFSHKSLKKFLRARGFSEAEFRQIVASIDEEKILGELKGRMSQEGATAFKETLQFFKSF